MDEPKSVEGGLTVGPESAQQNPVDIYETTLAESNAARKISRQTRMTLVALTDELNAHAVKEGAAKAEPLDSRKWYMVKSEFKQPISLLELKKSNPELADALQKPVIEKGELVTGDDLAKEVTDNSVINGVRIINNPDGEEFLGLQMNITLDPSGDRKQSVSINTHGNQGYVNLVRAGEGRVIEAIPGMKYETQQNATKITKMAQGVQNLMTANIQKGNATVSVL